MPAKKSAKKSVSFANQHGKPLVSTRYINKEGKSAPLEELKRVHTTAVINKSYIKDRRKATEKILKAQVDHHERRLKDAEKIHKDIIKLMKSLPNMSSAALKLQAQNKNMVSVIKSIKIDRNIAKQKLKAQKMIG